MCVCVCMQMGMHVCVLNVCVCVRMGMHVCTMHVYILCISCVHVMHVNYTCVYMCTHGCVGGIGVHSPLAYVPTYI